MSEENTGFWSTVCSIFSMSKSAIQITGSGLNATAKVMNEMTESMNNAMTERRVKQAEEWCHSQQDSVINTISGGFAIIVHDYYFSHVRYLMHKNKNDFNKMLENIKN